MLLLPRVGDPPTRVSESATWEEFCGLICTRLQLTSVRAIYHSSTMTPLTSMDGGGPEWRRAQGIGHRARGVGCEVCGVGRGALYVECGGAECGAWGSERRVWDVWCTVQGVGLGGCA
jgi:hypothetical protein